MALLLCLASGGPTKFDAWGSPAPQRVADSTRASEKDKDRSSELLVKLGGGLSEGENENVALRFFARHNLDVVKRLPRIDVWLVASPEMPAATFAHHLERSNEVSWAEPNGLVHASGITPNDNFYQAQQWNLRLIGLPEAWLFTTGDARPIAIIDTGIDLDHPDLAAKVWTNPDEVPDNGVDDDGNGYVDDVHGWNFVTGSTLILEANHGTHVAGIAGAHTDNSIGVAGVSWQSPLIALQALNSSGDGNWADVAEAVIYAADNGAHVLNLSLGGEESSQTIEDAVLYARDQGCLVVAAAGNSQSQPAPVEYPAALPGVLAVAATTDSDAPWSRSNRGPQVDVAAPGADIFSTSRYSQYATMSGTSMATPHVSGLAALVWALQPTLTADQVAHVITSTAHDVYTPGWDQRTGWGRIDAQAAVATFKPYRMYLPLVKRNF
ncbi:MAG: S8 family peptidase [Chloroflexota bacterium]|nr:S8 family peptidase [Chloroflexota bacterium]